MKCCKILHPSPWENNKAELKINVFYLLKFYFKIPLKIDFISPGYTVGLASSNPDKVPIIGFQTITYSE